MNDDFSIQFHGPAEFFFFSSRALNLTEIALQNYVICRTGTIGKYRQAALTYITVTILDYTVISSGSMTQ